MPSKVLLLRTPHAVAAARRLPGVHAEFHHSAVRVEFVTQLRFSQRYNNA
ncbi:MAG: hypothetical protein ACRDTC_10450 [Pseudonocardiaceae bacterium]